MTARKPRSCPAVGYATCTASCQLWKWETRHGVKVETTHGVKAERAFAPSFLTSWAILRSGRHLLLWTFCIHHDGNDNGDSRIEHSARVTLSAKRQTTPAASPEKPRPLSTSAHATNEAECRFSPTLVPFLKQHFLTFFHPPTTNEIQPKHILLTVVSRFYTNRPPLRPSIRLGCRSILRLSCRIETLLHNQP